MQKFVNLLLILNIFNEYLHVPAKMHAYCQTYSLHVSFQLKYISQVSLWPKQNSVSLHLTKFLLFRYFLPVLKTSLRLL